jgi:hypothetical protein
MAETIFRHFTVGVSQRSPLVFCGKTANCSRYDQQSAQKSFR